MVDRMPRGLRNGNNMNALHSNLFSLLIFPLTLVFLVNNSGSGLGKENACALLSKMLRVPREDKTCM